MISPLAAKLAPPPHSRLSPLATTLASPPHSRLSPLATTLASPPHSRLSPLPSITIPSLGPHVPTRGNSLTRALARLSLLATGWRFEGDFPDLPRFIIIVAPHTSDWDFFLGLMAMFAVGLRSSFLGKHTIFRWPFRALLRWLGGVPVDRTSPHHVVEQIVTHFRESDRLVLALSPEGTRRKREQWRTGFYFVARGAGVPIVPVAFDYSRRMFRIFPPFVATENQDDDFARLRGLFHAGMAKYPSQY